MFAVLFAGIQEDYFGVGRFSRQQPCDLSASRPQRRGVGNEHIGTEFTKLAQTLGCTASFSYHLDVRLVLQQTPQSLPQQEVTARKHAAQVSAQEKWLL